MKNPSFEVAQKVGTIVLGQIVVDEVCNKYKEHLEERTSKARKANQDLNDMMFTPHIVWNELDISDECRKYKDFLEMFIIESGMTIAEPYPNDAHEIIVQRALQGQLAEISGIDRKASFAELNVAAAGMVLETSGDLVRWVRGMGSFLETDSQRSSCMPAWTRRPGNTGNGGRATTCSFGSSPRRSAPFAGQ